MVTDEDLRHLRRCVELATAAVTAGDDPFGSVLVAGDGTVLHEDRNRESSLADPTRHPSGEHCPMCAAAHGWVGLGRIVYATSSEQLTAWRAELGAPASPLRPLAIKDVVPGVVVDGPAPELADAVRDLVRRQLGPATG